MKRGIFPLRGEPLANCSDVKDGWRTIEIATRLSCSVLAARHFPGNEEAVILGFSSAKIPSLSICPKVVDSWFPNWIKDLMPTEGTGSPFYASLLEASKYSP